MSMFSLVAREPVKCPTCGEEIKEFQTHSGFGAPIKLTTQELLNDAVRIVGNEERISPEYYGYCQKCTTKVGFIWEPGHWREITETYEERQRKIRKNKKGGF